MKMGCIIYEMKIRLVTMGRFHTYHQQILLHGPEEVTYEANINSRFYANPLYSYFTQIYRSKLFRRILGKKFDIIMNIAASTHNFYEKRQTKKGNHDLVHVCAVPITPEEPFILDFDNITLLTEFNEDKFRSQLSTVQNHLENCKRLVAWSDTNANHARNLIEDSSLKRKITTLHPARLAQNPSPIPHEGLNVVFGGSSNNPLMWEYKGGDLVLEAWKYVVDEFPHAILHVCAKSPKKNDFSAIPNVKWHDILLQNKYFDLLRRADLFIRPEKHTPAMGYVEAMDFGFPIIGLHVADNAAYIEHKKTGWLAPSPVKDRNKTIESLARGIAYFLESKDRRDVARDAQRKLVEPGGRFSMEQHNKKLLEIYENALII